MSTNDGGPAFRRDTTIEDAFPRGSTANTRVRNCLLSEGFKTLGNVADAHEAEPTRRLYRIRNFGRKSMAIVLRVIQGLNPPAPREAPKNLELRDYFAAKALTGLLASDEGEGDTLPMTEWIWSDIADCAYKMADAMLAARQHRDKPADSTEIGDRR